MKRPSHTFRPALITAQLLALGAITPAMAAAPEELLDRDVCPFECCSYGDWIVLGNTPLFASPEPTATTIAQLHKDDHVIGLTGDVYVQQPGRVVVTRPYTSNESRQHYAAGDELWVYTYQGEGFYKVWFADRFYSEEIPFMAGWDSCEEDDICWGKVVQTPKSHWHVQIKSNDGVKGWSHRPDLFGNKDTCG